MADNPNVVKQDSVNPNDQKQESINPTDVNQGQKDHSIPYSVFKEAKDQIGELKTQLAEISDKQNVARESKMKEEGQLKELLQEKNSLLDKQTTQLEEWATYKQNKRETLLDQIPESDRLIYSDLSLDKLEAHVNKTGKNISANTSKATGQRGAGGEMGGYDSFAEWASKDPEGYKKNNMTSESKGIKIGYGNF